MTPLHDEAHAVTGFVVSTVDITSLDRDREADVDSARYARPRPLTSTMPTTRPRSSSATMLRADVVVIAVSDDDGSHPTNRVRRTVPMAIAAHSSSASPRAWQSALERGRVVASRG